MHNNYLYIFLELTTHRMFNVKNSALSSQSFELQVKYLALKSSAVPERAGSCRRGFPGELSSSGGVMHHWYLPLVRLCPEHLTTGLRIGQPPLRIRRRALEYVLAVDPRSTKYPRARLQRPSSRWISFCQMLCLWGNGHLSRSCPDNPRGAYADRGGGRLCGFCGKL